MRFRSTLWLAPVLLALAILAFALPSGAELCEPYEEEYVEVTCPCWPEGLPEEVPLFCHDHPGMVLDVFAYFVGPLPVFAQVTDLWCRTNFEFEFVTPLERDYCLMDLLELDALVLDTCEAEDVCIEYELELQ